MRSAPALARARSASERARALFAGCAAHSILPLEQPRHGVVRAGARAARPRRRLADRARRLAAIADALAAHLRSLGGEIRTASPVESLDDLPPARAVLLDLTPRQVLRIAGDRLPGRLPARARPLPLRPRASFKLDWALDGPIPWTAPECRRAGTVHLGGTLEEIAAAERAVAQGSVPERPFVLLAQQTPVRPEPRARGQAHRLGRTATCRTARRWT